MKNHFLILNIIVTILMMNFTSAGQNMNCECKMPTVELFKKLVSAPESEIQDILMDNCFTLKEISGDKRPAKCMFKIINGEGETTYNYKYSFMLDNGISFVTFDKNTYSKIKKEIKKNGKLINGDLKSQTYISNNIIYVFRSGVNSSKQTYYLIKIAKND